MGADMDEIEEEDTISVEQELLRLSQDSYILERNGSLCDAVQKAL